MSKRTNIYGFLELNHNWDPSLLFVLMTGVMVNLFTFNLIKRLMYSLFYLAKLPALVKKLKILVAKLHSNSYLEHSCSV